MKKSNEAFWKEISGTSLEVYCKVLRSDELKNRLLSHFAEHLKGRYTNRKEIDRHIQMNKDKSKFKIAPHTDTEIKLLFGIFYMAENDLYPQLCTSMYRHVRDLRSWKTTPRIKVPERDFIRGKTLNIFLIEWLCS